MFMFLLKEASIGICFHRNFFPEVFRKNPFVKATDRFLFEVCIRILISCQPSAMAVSYSPPHVNPDLAILSFSSE